MLLFSLEIFLFANLGGSRQPKFAFCNQYRQKQHSYAKQKLELIIQDFELKISS
jgi:hypothetical protein